MTKPGVAIAADGTKAGNTIGEPAGITQNAIHGIARAIANAAVSDRAGNAAEAVLHRPAEIAGDAAKKAAAGTPGHCWTSRKDHCGPCDQNELSHIVLLGQEGRAEFAPSSTDANDGGEGFHP